MVDHSIRFDLVMLIEQRWPDAQVGCWMQELLLLLLLGVSGGSDAEWMDWDY